MVSVGSGYPLRADDRRERGGRADRLYSGRRVGGCLSKQDDSGEQLRLICLALDGHTAYRGRLPPGIRASYPPPGEGRPDDRLLSLSPPEMNAAIGLGKGLSNRQISQEMVLAEKTVKNLVSSALMKLGMARRTEIAVLVTRTLHHSEDPGYGGYRSSLFPDLVAEVTAALLDCTSETLPMVRIPPSPAVTCERPLPSGKRFLTRQPGPVS